jgi:hypothetical protein
MEGIRVESREKYCVVCGRRMLWRRKWRKDWENVRYCSRTCRSMGLGEVDRRIEAAMLELLWARGADKSICPSEAARIVAGAGWNTQWEPLMPAARRAARRLVARGLAEIWQRGRRVDASTARGPIRIRLRRGRIPPPDGH